MVGRSRNCLGCKLRHRRATAPPRNEPEKNVGHMRYAESTREERTHGGSTPHPRRSRLGPAPPLHRRIGLYPHLLPVVFVQESSQTRRTSAAVTFAAGPSPPFLPILPNRPLPRRRSRIPLLPSLALPLTVLRLAPRRALRQRKLARPCFGSASPPSWSFRATVVALFPGRCFSILW
jgi:hypothetical protein